LARVIYSDGEAPEQIRGLGHGSLLLGWSPDLEAGWEEMMELQFRPESCEPGEPPPWWSAIGLTADYLGGCAMRMTGAAPSFEADFSRLANELRENAFKYRASGDAEPVSASLYRSDRRVALRVSHNVGREQAEHLYAILRRLFRDHPKTSFVTQVESLATDESPGVSGSGLGLWMLIQEPDVRPGWRFDPVGEGAMRVTAWLSFFSAAANPA